MDQEQKKLILLVEDEAILALSTKQQLEKAGYEVIHAGNGEAAVEYALHGSRKIELILMDINLGSGIDGTEAARRIVSAQDIPVVFLSSHTEPEVVKKTEKITSYGYVVKNSGITVLDASIKMAFKLFNAHREINRKNMAIKAGNENLRVSIERLEETNKTLIQMENELRIRDSRFKKAQRIGRIGNWEYNIQENTIWGSEEARRIYGLPLNDELLSLEEVESHDYDKEKMYHALTALIQHGEPYDIEFQIKPRDSKKWIWLHSVAELYRNAEGKPVKVEGVVQDISAQKEAEFRYRKLTKAIENAGDIVLMTDTEGMITFVNPRFTEVYGYTKEEVIGKKTPGILSSKYPADGTGKEFWSGSEAVNPLSVLENVTKSGRKIFVEVKTDSLHDENGRLDGFLEIQRDITLRKSEEKHILKLNRLYDFIRRVNKAIVRSATEADLFNEICSIAVEYGQFMLAWVGLVDREVDRVEPVAHAGSDKGFLSKIRETPLSEIPHDLHSPRIMIRQGKEYVCNDIAADPEMARWRDDLLSMGCRSSIVLPIMVSGEFTGSFNLYSKEADFFNPEEVELLTDVTMDIRFALEAIKTSEKHRKAEAAVEESRKYLSTTLNSIGDGVITTDMDGRITSMNPVAENLTGWSEAEAQGKPLMEIFRIINAQTREPVTDPVKKVLDSGKITSLANHTVLQSRDGREYHITDSAAPIQTEGENRHGVVLVFSDVTDKKKAEEEIRNLLGEKELLLKEVHHRMKNNLNTIRSLLNLRADSLQHGDAAAALREAAGKVQSVGILYDILQQSGQFAHVSSEEFLTSLVRGTVDNLSGEQSVRVKMSIEPFILDTEKAQVLGLIVNELLTNVMKHAFAGRTEGTISVSAACSGEEVHITLADDGVGFPSSLDFDKTGDGFGLLLIKKLTEQLGGNITLERGDGTKIRLAFKL